MYGDKSGEFVFGSWGLNFSCYLVIKRGFEGRGFHGRGVGVCESGGNFDKAFKAAEK